MLAALMALMLQAAPAGAGPGEIPSPDWLRRPSGADLARFYPEAARRENLAGRVTLSCGVTAAGGLVDCTADDPGMFGEAALKMAGFFSMKPIHNGRSVDGGRVRIPIVFLMPNDFRAAPITVKDAEIHGAAVEMDCRFEGVHIDNCYPRHMAPAHVVEAATKLAPGVTLPPMPKPRGRIVLPLVFPAKAGMAADPRITNPRWDRRPTTSDLAKVYPAAARRSALDGAASVTCVVTGEGWLTNCRVEAETPGGAGFGEAAVRLMPLFRMKPADAFGVPVEGRTIRVPIQFRPIVPKRGTG